MREMKYFMIKNDELFNKIQDYDLEKDEYIYDMMKSDFSDNEKKEKIFSYLKNDFEYLSDKMNRIFENLKLNLRFYILDKRENFILFELKYNRIIDEDFEEELRENIYNEFQEEFDLYEDDEFLIDILSKEERNNFFEEYHKRYNK